jgi:hypothetical protein
MALQLHKGIKWVDHTYNVNCQYKQNIELCFEEHFPNVIGLVRSIRFWIPQLHVHGHKDDCQYRYLLSFADGCHKSVYTRLRYKYTKARYVSREDITRIQRRGN